MKRFFKTCLLVPGVFFILAASVAGQQIAELGRNNPFTPNPAARQYPEISVAAQIDHASNVRAGMNGSGLSGNSSVNPTGSYRIGADDVLRIDGLDGSGTAVYVTAIEEGSVLPGLERRYFFVGKTTDTAEAELSLASGNRSVRVSVRQYVGNYVLVSNDEMDNYRMPLMRSAVPLYLIISQLQSRSSYPFLHVTRRDGSRETVSLAERGSEDRIIFAGDKLRFSKSRD